ncbi:M10 family metallopeptidase C-terminal domain-containing protein [Pseudomonas typographi]|uniref:M10 family metallopeptidase C-terminal domain-containing protein n=1 Tax=Pseudomonas typographi TaxID=2715964 RepID=UPI0016829804|nr:M10 family metallopeptidase C-terminal domain-containing protein [Pseudomonas typographi]MBD1554564.1 calcium-binding protein [Pseudomonas typographi]
MATTDSKSAPTPTVRTGPGTVMVDLTGALDSNQSVTLQADGKILVGGYTYHTAYGYPGSPGDESYETRADYSVIRLNADGSLDTSFSQGGIDLVPADIERDTDYVMAVQADGKVLSAHPRSGGVTVERFNSDGTLDDTFGSHGAINIGITYSADGIAISANPDGTLYVSARGAGQSTVTKLNSDGTPAADFGDNGQVTLKPAGNYDIGDISTTVLPDGSFLLGSALYIEGQSVYSLERLTATGAVDTGFGDNGVLHFDPALGLDYFSAVTVQADGKIIVVGQSADYTVGNVLRLNADGSFDTSFGIDGKATFEVAPDDSNNPRSVTVQADGKILIAGQSVLNNNSDFGIIRLNADGSPDTTFGSPDGQLHVDGSGGQDTLLGVDTAEIIHGLGGDDVLQGNGGRDVLLGGTGADIFRFAEVSDSYRTATQTGSDRILDFDPTQDRVDLIALGFTGIGDGHNGTLAVQANADGTRTYLKSFDADAAGQRFELAFDGNLVGQLNSTNVVFTPPTVEGTSGGDVINGSALSEVIYGLAGNDRINGGAGADVILGGAGADQLNGGDGENVQLFTGEHDIDDVFVYTSASDSYRTDTQSFDDLIVNFADYSDKIDVSALGYTGFGDGTGTTLKVAYDSELDRTYLKDLEADAQGHRFEIALTGNWVGELNHGAMVFAPAAEVALVGVDTSHDPLSA